MKEKNNSMRILTVLSLLFLISACGSNETASYTASDITVSGEFLFEGPNTLQGASSISADKIASQVGITFEEIKAVYVSAATISFTDAEARSSVESALVQWVSDDLPLVSVATKSPLPNQESVVLEVNSEQDILDYIKDSSSTLVVDANLSKDADELEAVVSFQLNIVY